MAKPIDSIEHHQHQGWLKKLGLAGFLFFLVKGLLWLSLPAILVFFGLDS